NRPIRCTFASFLVQAAAGTHLTDNGVVLVATAGNGSMDRYAQKLAERLPVAKLETDIYQASAEQFGVGPLSRAALRSLQSDFAFVRLLRALDAELLHLPNHHLGRYGLFLSRPYLVTVHDL